MTFQVTSTTETSSNFNWLGLFLVAIGGLLAIAAYAERDYISLALLVTIPLIPVVFGGATAAVTGDRRYAWIAAIALLIIQVANFRYRAIDDKTIDWQVALKLSTLVVMAIAAVPVVYEAAQRGIPSHLAIWCVFLAFLVGSSGYAVTPVYSLIASSSVLLAFLFLMSVGRTFGPQGIRELIAVSAIVLCLASMFAYFAVPTFGRMQDWEHGQFVMTSRLQGILGSANAAGATAGLGLIFFSALVWRWRWLKVMIGCVLIFCLIASDNRMAMGATALAFATMGLFNFQSRSLLVALVAVALSIGLLAFAVAGDAILALVARSGSAEEVASATGRTVIWSAVLDLWQDRPLFGYGFASSQTLLPKHPALFKAAAHAHNLYLEILFAGGLVGFFLFASSLTASLTDVVRQRDPLLTALVVFFLTYGLTEPILSSVAGFPAYGLLATVILASGFEPSYEVSE